MATVFIIPKRKSYLICESRVALFVLLLFARVLFQFFYQQITEALRRDNIVPVACGITGCAGPMGRERVAETVAAVKRQEQAEKEQKRSQKRRHDRDAR